jgi:hypothetical protein
MYKSINKLAPQRLSNFFKIQMQCKIMIWEGLQLYS